MDHERRILLSFGALLVFGFAVAQLLPESHGQPGPGVARTHLSDLSQAALVEIIDSDGEVVLTGPVDQSGPTPTGQVRTAQLVGTDGQAVGKAEIELARYPGGGLVQELEVDVDGLRDLAVFTVRVDGRDSGTLRTDALGRRRVRTVRTRCATIGARSPAFAAEDNCPVPSHQCVWRTGLSGSPVWHAHAERPASGVMRLLQETHVPTSIDDTFTFFADAANLERLTPPWLTFEIRTPLPITMAAGVEIEYRIVIHGLPIPWRSRIEVWEPGIRFVDRQIVGPYRWWWHEHRFEAAAGGTRVIDAVEYAPRLPRISGTLVRRDLERIFSFRRESLARILTHRGGRPGV